MAELELCPFCRKSVAEVCTVAEAIGDYGDEWSETHYVAVCSFNKGGCGSCGPSTNDTPEKAAEAWNRRANIEKFPVVEHWISCRERLPNVAGEYLVRGRWYDEKPRTWICQYLIFGGIGGFANPAKYPPISFWRPMPEPPEGENIEIFAKDGGDNNDS